MSLFPPPQEIESTVAFELPDNLRHPNTYSDWGQNNQFGHMPDSFLEGPSFDRDGNLWMVNILFGQILRVTPNGEWSVATEYDGNPNGLKNSNRRPNIHRRLQERRHASGPVELGGYGTSHAHPHRALTRMQRTPFSLKRRSLFHRSRPIRHAAIRWAGISPYH
jgi:hypothetical protein